MEILKALNCKPYCRLGQATIRLTGSGIRFTQINLHHSKSALVLLAWSMAAIHTGIAIIQRP